MRRFGYLILIAWLSAMCSAQSTDFGLLDINESFAISAKSLFNMKLGDEAILYSYVYPIGKNKYLSPLIPMSMHSNDSRVYDPNTLQHTSLRPLKSINCTEVFASRDRILVIGCFNNFSHESGMLEYRYIGIINLAQGSLHSILDDVSCLVSFKAWGADILLCTRTHNKNEGEINNGVDLLLEVDYVSMSLIQHTIYFPFEAPLIELESYSSKCILLDTALNCKYLNLRIVNSSDSSSKLVSVFKISEKPYELISLNLDPISNIERVTKSFGLSHVAIYEEEDKQKIVVSEWSVQRRFKSNELRDCNLTNGSIISDCILLESKVEIARWRSAYLLDIMITSNKETNTNNLYIIAVDTGEVPHS